MSEGTFIPLQDKIRVLYINPDEALLKHYKNQLEIADPLLSIDPVLSSEEAQRRFREGWYECVISEQDLSGIDGIKLAAEFMEKRNIVFILWTSKINHKLMLHARDSGINEVLSMREDPWRLQVLASSIRKLVEQNRLELLYKEIVNQNPDPIVVLDGTRARAAVQETI